MFSLKIGLFSFKSEIKSLYVSFPTLLKLVDFSDVSF